MKKTLFLSFLAGLISLTSFATNLFPRGHSACLNQRTSLCTGDTQYYIDARGRCGCLTENEIIPPDTCMVSYIMCNEAEGESFSSMYQISETNGVKEQVYAGCGCYTDAPGSHPMRMRSGS